MKFLHASGLYIGKTVCGFSMLEGQKAALGQILATVREKCTDAVFLSGDFYTAGSCRHPRRRRGG